ncbi:MAG: hypothetical protein MZV70_58790 [Desulfobacterales bacterium]|nr:hypothetical protein [Desulfobacterales bacterium]
MPADDLHLHIDDTRNGADELGYLKGHFFFCVSRRLHGYIDHTLFGRDLCVRLQIDDRYLCEADRTRSSIADCDARVVSNRFIPAV